MEIDPTDGKIAFTLIDTHDFRIENMRDVADFWREMARIATALLEENGFIIYPIVEL